MWFFCLILCGRDNELSPSLSPSLYFYLDYSVIGSPTLTATVTAAHLDNTEGNNTRHDMNLKKKKQTLPTANGALTKMS